MKVETFDDVKKIMGQIVTVHAELKRKKTYMEREGSRFKATMVSWEREKLKEPRAGWVTGRRALQEGELKGGYYDGQGYLEQNDIVLALQVVYWPTLNPVHVPYDGINMGGEPIAPGWVAWKQEWKDELSEIMKVEMKNWPRDERGRWIGWRDMTDDQKREYEKKRYGYIITPALKEE